ncbi:hypothetical protein FMM05_02160 [Flavobacterium zepuense]|uniref:Uncharacterized protein n=1 Tax=Flavobacterium zepuense TaxID=2593302 RepID=A0A552VAG0_9FLAO|nr:hypothetical protein [Flavobacterium zepuense]TRW27466.1 hypothetical protein FMM05_02160 [Flavobacterium zepuense]
MKSSLIIAYLIVTGFCNAQQVPQFLQAAVNESRIDEGILKPMFSPQLSFYSKNYTRVFGRFNYTFDAQTSGQRNVYVSSDNKLYFGNINFITEMPIAGQLSTYNFNDADLITAVLSTISGDDLYKGLKFKLYSKK